MRPNPRLPLPTLYSPSSRQDAEWSQPDKPTRLAHSAAITLSMDSGVPTRGSSSTPYNHPPPSTSMKFEPVPPKTQNLATQRSQSKRPITILNLHPKDWDVIASKNPWSTSSEILWYPILAGSLPSNFYVRWPSTSPFHPLANTRTLTDCYSILPIMHIASTAVRFQGDNGSFRFSIFTI